MRILARRDLWQPSNDGRDEVLLEGGWAEFRASGRWSLDDSIDARFSRIDREAIELADLAGGGDLPDSAAISFPYINALALRYYFVKLLRVLAFFREVRPLEPGERIELHLASNRDEAYADLIEQLAERSGASLALDWHDRPTAKSRSGRRSAAWRQWADRARRWPASPVLDDDAPRVVLCGNPRILNPVCAALVEGGCRVFWLYERFAVRSWWRWRRAGVEQLVCDTDDADLPHFSDVWSGAELVCGDVDLARPVDRWLAERATDLGQQQSRLIHRIETHFSAVRPTALVLDEDATPLKRIATALARRHGARSSVVQHGAACGPFGFVPPAADEICVWGEPVRRQLETWGVEPWKIRVAGWPQLRPPRMADVEPLRQRAQPGTKRFLLLATVEPRDDRPDNVEFHLTGGNYAEMQEMVGAVLSQIEGAKLVIKLHPRSRQSSDGWLRPQGASVPVRVVQSKNLARLVAQSDCVLSCGSTAGIEAALAGAPVVQLLPAGSGGILPAEEWGFVGTARNADELAILVQAALARGWSKPLEAVDGPVAATGDTAAQAIVEGLLAACGASEFVGGGC